ncbi:uncharacterized protein TNCV_5050531 [Trichonephila clavipes]|nr:uncharacterized protein TNCV_5050531 [Trichonephila clavipes]
MAPHTITPAVGSKGRIEAFTTGSPHTNTIVIIAEIESGFITKRRPGSIPLQSSFLVRGTTPPGGVDGWVSRAAHVMGTAIPNVLQPGAFVWFEKTQGPPVKVLHMPGWRPMKQLTIRVHFLRCGGLLDDWSVERVLEPGLRVNDISRFHWSQHHLTTRSEWPN